MNAEKAGTIHRLLKIGKEEHIRSLYKNGVLFMKPLRYFINVENNSQQQDIFEGATHYKPFVRLEVASPDGGVVKFGSTPDCIGTVENGNMLFHPDTPMGNVYCMFAVTQELIETKSLIDKRNKEFGDTLLLIHNPKPFFKRVYSALEEKGIKFECGLVDYFTTARRCGQRHLMTGTTPT